MSKSKTSVLWKIICAVVCVIVLPLIIFNVVLVAKSMADKENLPTIFGYAPTAVISGSMTPTFNENDIIIIKEVEVSELKAKEDIICFKEEDKYVTHRLLRIEEVDGETRYYTGGDFTGSEDEHYVLAEQIQGKYVYKIAGLGGVIMFLQTPYGLILTVIALIMLYVLGELIWEWREEHKENKRLKEENERLKAQLNIE